MENVGLDALDELMTVPEVATVLRVSKPTVWRLIYSGALESTKINSARRVSQGAVKAYLKRRTTSASTTDAVTEPPASNVA